MKKITRVMLVGVSMVALTGAMSGIGATAGTRAPRTLPKGDRMFTIPCNTAPRHYHLFRAKPVTGAFVSIGGSTDIEGSTCAYGMAFDPAKGKSYFLAGNTSTGNWPLMKVNLNTGAETFVADINVGGTPVTDFPAVVAISNSGNAYVIAGNNLYSLNLATGAAVMIGATGSSSDIYSFAIDPTTNKLYAVGEAGEVYRINRLSGNGTLLGTVPTSNSSVYSLQIDTRGVLWINEGGSDPTNPPRIGSFRLSNIAGSLIGSSGPMKYYSGAFLITH